MMSQPGNTPGKPEFKQLWPTQFMSLSLPGHDTANPVLADHLLEQNVAREDMTVDYISDNLFMTDHPAVIWLRQCCDRAVLDYARHAGIDYELEWILQGWANVNMRGDYHNLHNHPHSWLSELEWILQGWANVNMRGDYHNLHNHPHSWLSGTYYVSVPDQSDADTFRSDLNPSAISFFDPRPQANMNSIRNDGQVDAEYRLLPNNGDLFLWPAFLHHLVHPNMTEMPRISVSFNVVLKWKNDYIPR